MFQVYQLLLVSLSTSCLIDFFSFPAWYRYWSLFLLFFNFTLLSTGTVRFMFFFCWLLLSLVVWIRWGDPFVSKNPWDFVCLIHQDGFRVVHIPLVRLVKNIIIIITTSCQFFTPALTHGLSLEWQKSLQVCRTVLSITGNPGCTTWTLTKRLKKKIDGNYTRMLRAILNKSLRQHPQTNDYTATCLPSRKLSKLDKPDMKDTPREAGTSS